MHGYVRELAYMVKSRNEKRTPVSGTRLLITLGILLTLLLLNVGVVGAAASASPENPVLKQAADEQKVMMMHNVTNEERLAAAKEAAAKGLVVGTSGSSAVKSGFGIAAVPLVPVPGGTPDYFGPYSNYANSQFPATDGLGNVTGGGIRKFVDSLPGLGPTGANNLGNYIPVATADKISYPGSDYYEIGLVEYHQKLHSDINSTLLEGYVQIESPNVTGSLHIPLFYPNGTAIRNASGGQVFAMDNPRYLGPAIVGNKDVPVRVKFQNYLPVGTDGNLFIPVDTSIMGAGLGPDGVNSFKQNRATIHLHGGNTPWISDGTPMQWTTPAGENTPYPKGVATQNVPDMDGGIEPQGTMTFYYTNQQSARLMFYHDHVHGITRLNVYAGEAAPYIVRDSAEQALITAGTIPTAEIPLVLQDKSFVPDAAQMNATDPTWNWGDLSTPWPHTGSLYYPHVYMPIQNPYNRPSSDNPMGRWDYGPWFWPPFTGFMNQPVPNPYAGNGPWEPPFMPATPNPSQTPESFMDTMLVNGAAYPYVQLGPHAYRFRILNACNDRTLNLALFNASSSATMWNGQTLLDGNAGEINMTPAIPGQLGQPADWPTDGRAGGVPWANTSGPSWVQFGTEGGFMPAPKVIAPRPTGYDLNHVYGGVVNVQNSSLMLMPAQRADVVVDFTGYPDGAKLILWSDAPAPAPGGDSRYDYYTGDPDQTLIGGANTTYAGYGPNTRTIMQIQINASIPGQTFSLPNLQAQLPAAYAVYQDKPLVPEAAYNTAFNAAYPNQYVALGNLSATFVPAGQTSAVTLPLQGKTVIGDFEMEYGRLTALLGVEIPRTSTSVESRVAYQNIDPPTELFSNSLNATPIGTLADGTQIWRITNVDVDMHPLHWHMFNLQVVNRVIWDGTVLPPAEDELGWRETVNIMPLTDTIVAMRPIIPVVPWELPNSIRPLDVTQPLGGTMFFGGIDPTGGQAPTVNHLVNFGWEYTYHCHILGHEENDFMRVMGVAVAPALPPSGLTAAWIGPNSSPMVNLTWTDNSIAETDFSIQRAGTSTGPWTDLAQIPSAIGPQKGGTATFSDSSVAPNVSYFYRVIANNVIGDRTVYTNTVGYPTVTANSTPSNVAPVTLGTTNIADFVGVPTSGIAPLKVSFTDLSTNSPFAWAWTFGDGSVENATVQNPVHTYSAPGTFTVSLTATGTGGISTATKTNYIVVSPAPGVSSGRELHRYSDSRNSTADGKIH